LTPGGLWDADKYEIKALIKHEGRIMDSVTMKFAGPSVFQAEPTVTRKGQYEIIIYAHDPLTGNSGVDKVKVTVN